MAIKQGTRRMLCRLALSMALVYGTGQAGVTQGTPPAAASAAPARPAITTRDTNHPGDMPDDPGQLATDVDAALNRKSIEHAMRKVADWQLKRALGYFNEDWTYATLYRGFLAASQTLQDARYEQAVLDAGGEFKWQLGPRISHADDEAIAQSYLYFYDKFRNDEMIAPTRQAFDKVMGTPDDPRQPLWWWSDALFMAPVSWVRVSQFTGNPAYLAYMDRQWWITSNLLYDKTDHLYTRDATSLGAHESNGRKVYWSRGNGWVFAGLASVLATLPSDYPHRDLYLAQFREMAAELASLQGSDGLWRSGLLDANAYPLPEVSGSAFFVYGMAWGINNGLLDRAAYMPVVEKGWKGLASNIYADGRLGSIQPIGGAPGKYSAGSSYVFGVGAFLMAGAEVDRLAPATLHKRKRKRWPL